MDRDGLIKLADSFCRDHYDIRSDPESMADFALGVTERLRAEIERLQEHKRKQAEDIMTLGQMVGSLEAEIERLRAEREQWHREAEMWHREYLRRAILGNRLEQ